MRRLVTAPQDARQSGGTIGRGDALFVFCAPRARSAAAIGVGFVPVCSPISACRRSASIHDAQAAALAVPGGAALERAHLSGRAARARCAPAAVHVAFVAVFPAVRAGMLGAEAVDAGVPRTPFPIWRVEEVIALMVEHAGARPALTV